jgi:hypothetical protein
VSAELGLYRCHHWGLREVHPKRLGEGTSQQAVTGVVLEVRYNDPFAVLQHP